MQNTTIETIHETTHVGRQSLELERVVKVGDLKLRVSIDRDSHDFQSSAKVEAWTTEAGWKYVLSIPIEETKVGTWSYVQGNQPGWKTSAQADADDLIARALAVLA